MICLVTDRRRLLAVGRADADGPDPWRACLAVQVRHAVAAGVDLIHLRERDLEAGALASLVTQLLAITAGSSTRLVVSDRVDIALACGADGVHLRGDSIPAAAARRLAPDGFLVGRSVHSRSEALAAADADYLIAGTVFASPSKPGLVTLLGTNGLRAITRAVERPVLAIGGITAGNVREVADAGAAGFAAIGLFMSPQGAGPTGCAAADLHDVVRLARSKFDTLKPTP